MSLTTWLSRMVFSKKIAADQVFELHHTEMSGEHHPSGKPPSSRVASASSVQSLRRKAERQAHRELLYTVVRDVMTRAEVLAASYKFKILSLDSGGRQYIIMIDLAHEKGKQSGWLAEMESQMVRRARKSHDITVMAVYWRIRPTAVAGGKSGSELSARQNQSR